MRLTAAVFAAASAVWLPIGIGVSVPSPAIAATWEGPAALGVEIKDRAGGPVAGAVVRIRLEAAAGAAADGPNGPPPARTDASGATAFGGLAEGEWFVEVAHQDFMSFTAYVTLRAGKAPKTGFTAQVTTPNSSAGMRVVFAKPRSVPPRAAVAAVAAPAAPSAPLPATPATPSRPAAPVPSTAPAPPATTAPPSAPAPVPTAPAPATTPPPSTAPASPPPATPATPSPAAAPVPPPTTTATAPAPPASAKPTPSPPPPPTAAPPAAPAQPVSRPPTPTAPAPAAPPTGPATSPSSPADPVVSTPPTQPAAPKPPAPPAPVDSPTIPTPSTPAPVPPTTQPPSPPAPVVTRAPAIPPPSAAPTAPLAPAAPGPTPAVRTADRGNCPECRPGESAVTIEARAAAAGGDCEAGLAAARAGAKALQPPSGAVPGADFGTHAGPSGGSCQVLAILLPRGARYLGYRYEAEDNRQGGDCGADADCTVGEAVWRGHPTLERRTDGTLVFAVFENRSAQMPRIARLTAYFRTSATRP